MPRKVYEFINVLLLYLPHSSRASNFPQEKWPPLGLEYVSVQ